MFLGDFSCFPTGPKVVPKTAKLVPDSVPTGSRLAKSGVKKCRIGADWILTGSRLDPWIGKNPLSHIFSPSRTHLCPCRAPIPTPLHQDGKSSFKPNRALQCMYLCMYVCTYARMYVCMYVCMHVCMYVCILYKAFKFNTVYTSYTCWQHVFLFEEVKEFHGKQRRMRQVGRILVMKPQVTEQGGE